MDHSLSTSSTNALTFSDSPVEAKRCSQLAEARRALLQFAQSQDAFSFNGRPNAALDAVGYSAEGSIAASVHGENRIGGHRLFLTFLVDAHHCHQRGI